MFFFLTCVSISSMSVDVSRIRQRVIIIRRVLLLAMLSLTTKSISWPLCGILPGILFGILLSSVMLRSTASIWSVRKPLTFSGMLFFGISEEFSFRSSFTFSVPTKMVWALHFVFFFKIVYLLNEGHLTDLSEAFNCISHDLLIARLNAYGFDQNALNS